MRAPIRGVLLDLYGTLVQSNWIGIADRSKMARHVSVNPAALADAFENTLRQRTTGSLGSTPAGELVHIIAASGGDLDQSCLTAVLEVEREHWRENTRLYPDALPAVQALHARGMRLGIVSNCSWQGRVVISNLDLDRRVECILLSCEEHVAKPDAAIYRCALERLGLEPEETLFVDDAAENLDGALRVGLRTALIDRTARLHSRYHPKLATLNALIDVL